MDRWPRISLIVWTLIVVAGVGRAALYHLPRHCGCYDVFADGGRHWRDAEPVYDLQHPDSLVVFRYSPLVAVGCVPLALVAAPLGSAMLRLVNLAVLLIGLAAWIRTVPISRENRAKWWLFVALAGGPALLDVQLNLITLGFMLLGIAAFTTSRFTLSVMALSLATCLKAYPIALALLLVLNEPRRFGPRLLAGLLTVLALPFAFQSPEYVTQQYRDWLVAGLNARYADGAFQDVMFVWQRWLWPMERTTFLSIAVLVGAGIGVLVLIRRPSPAVIFGLGCAWMMAFGPATEATTYVLLAPAAASAIVLSWTRATASWLRWTSGLAYGLLALSQAQLLFPLGRPLHHVGAQPVAGIMLLVVFAGWPSRRDGGTNKIADTVTLPAALGGRLTGEAA